MHDQPAGPVPETPIADTERQVVVGRIRRAMVDDLIEFDAIDERFAAIYAANTRAELALVTQDLPQLPPPMPARPQHPVSLRQFSVFGDIKSVGDVSEVDGDVSYKSIFGSVVVDLSSMIVPPEGISISANSVFDNVTVIVPDGYRVAIDTRSVFDSSKQSLSPPLPGAATIRVRTRSVFGSTKLYSLSRVPEGRLRRMWNKLRGRAAAAEV